MFYALICSLSSHIYHTIFCDAYYEPSTLLGPGDTKMKETVYVQRSLQCLIMLIPMQNC